MFGNFITAPQVQEHNPKKTRNATKNIYNHTDQVKYQIKDLISKMPSQQICTKAALNSGISVSLLDFRKILSKVEETNNTNVLNLIHLQLKNLKKEVMKIKSKDRKNRSVEGLSILKKSAIKTHQNSSRLSLFEDQKQQQLIQDDKSKAIQAEMAFRIKIKKFYSTQKINKKEQILKKRAQKAKQFNSKAQKIMRIYKTFKSKQQKQQNYFKNDPIQPNDPNMNKKFSVPESQDPRNTIVINIDASCQYLEKNDDVAIEREVQRCRTAYAIKTHYPESKMRKNVQPQQNKNKDKSIEQISRQIKTRERKRQIQQRQEENAIAKYINKQHKIQRGRNNKCHNLKRNMKKEKQNLQESQLCKIPSLLHSDSEREDQIKQKCEQKQFKKQLRLKERVNKIKDALKIKQERIEKHKILKQKYHQQEIMRNEQYMQNYMARLKYNRQEKQARHELSIRNRFEQCEKKKLCDKEIEQVSRWPDKLLERQYKKIKDKQLMSSLKNIFLFHCVK